MKNNSKDKTNFGIAIIALGWIAMICLIFYFRK